MFVVWGPGVFPESERWLLGCGFLLWSNSLHFLVHATLRRFGYPRAFSNMIYMSRLFAQMGLLIVSFGLVGEMFW